MAIVNALKSEQYDFVVIGSGLAALGAVEALKESGVDYCVVARDVDKEYKYPNTQLITSDLLGGAANYWHGVIPLGIDTSDEFKSEFSKYYPSSAYIENLSLFIPRSPINSRKYIDLDRVRKDSVKKLEESGEAGVTRLLTKSGCVILAKHVILAAGVRATGELLKDSGLIVNDSLTIDDHVCGYVGMISAKRASELLGRRIQSEVSGAGYHISCLLDDVNNVLFTFRPACLEMKNEHNQLRGGPMYANSSKLKIAFDILKQGKLGRLIEGVALKFGLLFSSRNYSVHFQAVDRAVHRLERGKWMVSEEFEELRSRVADAARKQGLDISKYYASQRLYYGNHLFNLDYSRSNSSLWESLSIVDASDTENIGGTHHSFRQMVAAYRKIKYK